MNDPLRHGVTRQPGVPSHPFDLASILLFAHLRRAACTGLPLRHMSVRRFS